jgi:hypothetical protein
MTKDRARRDYYITKPLAMMGEGVSSRVPDALGRGGPVIAVIR